MSSYHQFNEFPDALLPQLFRPVGEVVRQVEGYVKRFSPYTVGMHVRRTDNSESTERSPLSLFVDKGREELKWHNDLTIFLATDSEDVKREMTEAFGDRIVTSSSKASRDSVAGVRGGLAEMYALAACQRIYGSAGSSFSPMAASLSNGNAAYECLATTKK